MSRSAGQGTYSAVVHGYRLLSDVDLHLLPADGPPDLPTLRLRRGENRAVPREAPPGVELSRIEDAAHRVFYAVAATDDRLVIRFYGVCEFVSDPGLTDVVVHVDPEVDAALVPVLVAGTLVTVRLVLDGHLVMHASAVEVAGRALAFVGASGMGKSTMATLLCAAGHPLVSDDVLRVSQRADGEPVVWPGASETRLRKAAAELQAQFAGAGPGTRTTADGRTAILAPSAGADPLPLAACVVPLPSHDLEVAEVERLTPLAALTSLLRFPRLLGWTDRTTTGQQFEQLSELVERVPVYEARLPWGPPFRPTLAAELVGLLHL